MHKLQPHSFPYQPDTFSSIEIFDFKSFLYRLLREHKQKRHQQHRVEQETGPASENVLGFQTKGDESDEKQR